MPAEQRTIFVYYRVAPEATQGAQAAVRQLFAALSCAVPGLQTQLMCKLPDVSAAGEATWMEVYAHPQGVPDDFLARLTDQAHTLLAHQTGPRHVEVFTPMPGSGLGSLG